MSIKYKNTLTPDNVLSAKYIRPYYYKMLLDKQYGEKKWWDFDYRTIYLDLFPQMENSVFEPGDAPNKPTTSFFQTKISALQTILANPDGYATDYQLFEKVMLAFNDQFIDYSILQVCSPEEIAYGVTVSNEVLPNPDFEYDVKTYIQGCCYESGLVVFHKSFAFAEPEDRESDPPEVKKIVAQFQANFFSTPEARYQKLKLDAIDDYIATRYSNEKKVLAFLKERGSK